MSQQRCGQRPLQHPATYVLFNGGARVAPSSSTRGFMTAWCGQHPIWVGIDGGSLSAIEWGRSPDVVIGDFDSMPAVTLDHLRSAGVETVRAATDKNETDLELALDWVRSQSVGAAQPVRVLVVGLDGGRIDHLITALGVLCSPRYELFELAALGNDATYFVVRHRVLSVAMPVGTTFSLVPILGDASAVRCLGATWPLEDEVLHAGGGRGCSNTSSAPEIAVSAGAGVLALIIPVGSDGRRQASVGRSSRFAENDPDGR